MAAYPPSSWPRVTGVASIRCVRPDFTASANSALLVSSDACRVAMPSSRSRVPSTAATWIADGKVSLEDWAAFTWSLGCTSTPCRWARVAMTSLRFMLVLVPEPVWKTSIGNWSSCSPLTTSAAAVVIALACSVVRAPRSTLVCAAAALMRASAWMSAGSSGCPLIGKFSTARWVCARHSASFGTRTSPMESCSMR